MFKKRLISYLFIFLLNVPALIALSTCFENSGYALAQTSAIPRPNPTVPPGQDRATVCGRSFSLLGLGRCPDSSCVSPDTCRIFKYVNPSGVLANGACCVPGAFPSPSSFPSPVTCACSSPTGIENQTTCSGNAILRCSRLDPSNINSRCSWSSASNTVCSSTQYQKCLNGACVTCSCGTGFTPTQKRCSLDGRSIETCNFSLGSVGSPPTCTISSSSCIPNVCALVGTTPVCTATPCPRVCNPGDQQCIGINSTQYKVCKANGCGWDTSNCSLPNVCKTLSSTRIRCDVSCDMCQPGNVANGALRCGGTTPNFTIEKCNTSMPGCFFEKISDCLLGQQCTNGQCQNVCGDYQKTGPEQCDDGNVISGDGCSSTCVKEGCSQITDLSKCIRATSDCGSGFLCILADIGGVMSCACEKNCSDVLAGGSCSQLGKCIAGQICRSSGGRCGCVIPSPTPYYRSKENQNKDLSISTSGMAANGLTPLKIKKQKLCTNFKLKLEKDELGKTISPIENICLNGGICEVKDEVCGVFSDQDPQTREETYKCACQKACEKLSPPNCGDGYAYPKTCGEVDDPENPGLKKCGVIEEEVLKLDAVDSIESDEGINEE